MCLDLRDFWSSGALCVGHAERRTRERRGSGRLVGWSAVPSVARLVVVLGSVNAIGPLSIDMYLPAFPEIARASTRARRRCSSRSPRASPGWRSGSSWSAR